MEAQLGREIGLLRTITKNLVSEPALGGMGESTRILPVGHAAFADLSTAIVDRIPAIGRGANFIVFDSKLLDYVADHFLGRKPEDVGAEDAVALLLHCEDWFAGVANACIVFVPCVITRLAAPRFSVGPVVFIYIDHVPQSEFYPPRDANDACPCEDVDRLLKLMRDNRACWLACAPVEGCEPQRAIEIGSLAVDLAIGALQLAWFNSSTRSMSRLDSRRGAADKITVSKVGSRYNSEWMNMDAGMGVGPGILADIFDRHNEVIEAIGNCVRSFATGQFRLPTTEQAWCDAAYWLHDALAEPVDSISIAKLETALEVLLRSENRSGSLSRVLIAIDLFLGLKPDDTIIHNSPVTAKQFAMAVVSDRSKILHGTLPTLNSRLARNRAAVEAFVIAVVRRAVLELDAYAGSARPEDNIDDFLSWVRQRRDI